MKLKTIEIDGATYAEVKDGKPLYEDDDGKEVAFDAAHSAETIRRLNGEAKGHREAKEAAEEKLAAYGDLDPETAQAALETVANLDQQQLVDAGKVEEIKAEAIKAAEEKSAQRIKALEEELATKAETAQSLEATLSKTLIGNAFAGSKFVADNVAIPPDLLQARFGQQFQVEEGRVVAYDNAGNKLYSKSKPGELASFDEAIEILVDAYPYRDDILKGRQQQGAGAQPGQPGGGKKISRAQFDQLPEPEKRAKISEGVEVVD